MNPIKTDLLQGTLDLLILKTVALGPQHGYGISLRIQQISREALQVRQGSLYPALHRLERRGWIAAEWGDSENNRRAKVLQNYARRTASIGSGRNKLGTAGGCYRPDIENSRAGSLKGVSNRHECLITKFRMWVRDLFHSKQSERELDAEIAF